MKNNIFIRFIFCSMLFSTAIVNAANAQKPFNLTLHFPEKIDVKKIMLSYDNGKVEIPIPEPVYINDEIVITGFYFDDYASIRMVYPELNKESSSDVNIFFVNEIKGDIFFLKTDSTKSFYENFKLVNTYDFKKEKTAMERNEGIALKAYTDYLTLKNHTLTTSDEIKTFGELQNAVDKKELEYIIKHPNNFYSFWCFRRHISRTDLLQPLEFIELFNKIFSDTFKRSEGAAWMKDLWEGRINVNKSIAPDFTCKDIKGNTISLANYREKKYVLLVFWATWCGPCMAELPALKLIHQNYKTDNIEIISVSSDDNYVHFEKVIKENKMDWIQVFNGRQIINAYGGKIPLPTLFLIDKNGKIVYAIQQNDERDVNLVELNNYLKKVMP